MKHTITIEIDIDGFNPLVEFEDDGETPSDKIIYTEDEFVGDLQTIIADKLEDWDIVGDHFDEWPEEWEYLPDCCRKLEIKVNGSQLTIGRREAELAREAREAVRKKLGDKS